MPATPLLDYDGDSLPMLRTAEDKVYRVQELRDGQWVTLGSDPDYHEFVGAISKDKPSVDDVNNAYARGRNDGWQARDEQLSRTSKHTPNNLAPWIVERWVEDYGRIRFFSITADGRMHLDGRVLEAAGEKSVYGYATLRGMRNEEIADLARLYWSDPNTFDAIGFARALLSSATRRKS